MTRVYALVIFFFSEKKNNKKNKALSFWIETINWFRIISCNFLFELPLFDNYGFRFNDAGSFFCKISFYISSFFTQCSLRLFLFSILDSILMTSSAVLHIQCIHYLLLFSSFVSIENQFSLSSIWMLFKSSRAIFWILSMK